MIPHCPASRPCVPILPTISITREYRLEHLLGELSSETSDFLRNLVIAEKKLCMKKFYALEVSVCNGNYCIMSTIPHS